MPVVQHSLSMSAAAEAGIRAGDYALHGGVVRNQAGQIVEILREVSPGKAARLGKEGLQRARSGSTGVAIGIGIVIVASGAALLAARNAKAPQPELPALPACVENFNTSLPAYLEAARDGTLSAEIIDRLIADLEATKAASDSGAITIEFSPERLQTLLDFVSDHTRMLIEANHLGPDSLPERSSAEGATIFDLLPYLRVQRELFRRED